MEDNFKIPASIVPAVSVSSPSAVCEFKEPAELPIPPPAWLAECTDSHYYFEVIKEGLVIDKYTLQHRKSVLVGRLETCDLTLLHPLLSRKHAVLLFSMGNHPTNQPEEESNPSTTTAHLPKGWYLYDLGSTHGTFLNKVRVTPQQYHRVRVGHVLKFAGSTRLFVMHGPEEDVEPQSKYSWSEIKQRYQVMKDKIKRIDQADQSGNLLLGDENELDNDGPVSAQSNACLWGMADDAEEEDDVNAENPFAQLDTQMHEDAYRDDPKKALKSYFDRENVDMPAFEFIEAGFGRQHCRIELQVDSTAIEGPLIAEAIVSGKRREAIHACALEACRLLDKMGELYKVRTGAHEDRLEMIKAKLEANEFYSSDEDTFLDRTGLIEVKRKVRMQRAGLLESTQSNAVSYASIVAKLKMVEDEIQDLDSQIEKARRDLANEKKASEIDELEAYMAAIQSGAMDRATRMKIKSRLIELRREQMHLQRLANKAKPADLPSYVSRAPIPKEKENATSPDVEASSQSVAQKPMYEERKFYSKVMETEDHEEETELEESVKPSVKEIVQPTPKEVQPRSNEVQPAPKEVVQSLQEDPPVTTNIQEQEKKEKLESVPTAEVPPVPESVKGPTMPSNWRELLAQQEGPAVPPKMSKKNEEYIKRKATTLVQANAPKKSKNDPEEWFPPTDQHGDGKTLLNQRLGY